MTSATGKGWGRLATALLISASVASLAMAQNNEGTRDADGIQISVRDVTTQGQLVRVPVNKSVLVDFSRPVAEARLAKPDIADVTATSPRQLIITGRAFGTTQLIVWFSETEQRVFDVAVDLEMERLLASIRTSVPRARVQAHALLDAVVLTGDVPSADDAERILQIAGVFSPNVINHMRVAGAQQVMLRCTVAEVSRSATRQLGFNGFIAGDTSNPFAIQNLSNINPSNIGAPEGALATSRIPFVVGQGGIPVGQNSTLSIGFPRIQMQVFIQALKENGLLRVLAEPNLVAINGQEASFLAGGEVPIPITTSDRIKIEYKEFGVRLNFTPVVLNENTLRLKVSPELSEPDFTNSVTIGGISIPGFATRRVSTVVEIGPGQTFALGGLINERVRAVVRKIPALGDIPVLGPLFSSVEYQSDETELVVLCTPELVEPIAAGEVTYVPGADHKHPNDIELFLMGEMGEFTGEAVRPGINQTSSARVTDEYGPTDAFKLRGPVGPVGYGEEE